MKVCMECAECKEGVNVDLIAAIRFLIDCAENRTMCGGFMCDDCVRRREDEEEAE